MKKLILALSLIGAIQSYAQVSDKQVSAALTSTCSNANTTCDTAGVTVFSQYGDVLGPQAVEVNTGNYGLAQITIHGTYAGVTENFEYSDDGGTIWYPEICSRSDTNIQEGSEAVGSNATQGWECSVGAATRFRVRQSAFGSGSPIVRVILTAGLVEPAPTVAAIGAAASGSASIGGPVLIGGLNGSNIQSAAYDNTGAATVVGRTAAGNAIAGNPVRQGVNSNGNVADIMQCDTAKVINPSTATTTLLLTAVAAKNNFICSLVITGAAAQTVVVVDGTQTTNPCDTTQTILSPAYQIPASATNITLGSGLGYVYKTTAVNRQICITTSAAAAVNIGVSSTTF